MRTLVTIIIVFIASKASFTVLPIKENLVYHLTRNVEVDKVNLLCLNTWGLPIPLHPSRDENRYEKITSAITNSDYHIICLQETFYEKLRNRIYDVAKKTFYISGNLKKSRFAIFNMDCTGGLKTLSKFPIVKEKFIPFPINKNTSIIERIGRKGFLISYLKMNSDTMIVVNTHLYAGGDLHSEKERKDQISFINNYLSKMKNEIGKMPLILMGDLNTNQVKTPINKNIYNYGYLTKELKFEDSMPVFKEANYSFDPMKNQYADKDQPRQKLDYIMKYDPMGLINFVKSEVVFSYDKSVSDHCGISATIDFTNKNNISYYSQKK